MTQDAFNEPDILYPQDSLAPKQSDEEMPQPSWKDYLYLLLLSGVVVGLDQWTKALVRENLSVGQIWDPLPGLPFIRIVHWHNTGAAFGLFQDLGHLFTILAFLVAGAIIYYFPRVPRRDWPLRLAMGLQLGGALGNLIDRITIGRVTDFVLVGDFPVFNVADASISIGVAVLVISVWVRDRSTPVNSQGGSEDLLPDSGPRHPPHSTAMISNGNPPARMASPGVNLERGAISEDLQGGRAAD